MRVVRQADGSVAYDPKGKMAGRGAYVCAQTACIALARKHKKLERSLKVSGIPDTLFQDLELHAASPDVPVAAPRNPESIAPAVLANTSEAPHPPAVNAPGEIDGATAKNSDENEVVGGTGRKKVRRNANS